MQGQLQPGKAMRGGKEVRGLQQQGFRVEDGAFLVVLEHAMAPGCLLPEGRGGGVEIAVQA
ncbi:hypothetical protein GALL_438930 [mine drainage metagenome]|uniref:Uncharacterized protein n=1 Tax=mine drainage metagenome TaxID=410659 RepID=A0A1J5Q381_9ZZZZ